MNQNEVYIGRQPIFRRELDVVAYNGLNSYPPDPLPPVRDVFLVE